MSSELIQKDALARKTLDGKPATNQDFAKRIADYLLGDALRGIEPLSPSEIMKKLGYKDFKSIRQFKDLAVSLGYIELDSDGKPKLPDKSKFLTQFKRFDEENNQFTKNPLVAKWMQDLLTRKKGKPIASWKSYIATFKTVCNTTKTNPEQWITGRNILEVLEQGRTYMKQFLELYKQRKAAIDYDLDWSLDNTNIESIAYSYSKGTRDFMRFWGFPYAKGETGVMSQNIRSFHGKYADVNASDEQITIGKEFIKKTDGFDSDLYRAFSFGIDSCARKNAILGATTHYTSHTSKKTGKITYIMEVFESKTEHIKGGIRTKYIIDSDLQKSIDLVKSRGGTYIIEDRADINKTYNILSNKLREVYKVMGIAHLKPRVRTNPETAYPLEHPFHTLRHLGAHYRLRKTKYHYGVVARIGDWKTIDELKDSYGEMPPEVILEILEDENSFGGVLAAQ